MQDVITNPEQVTAAWLTEVLRRSGVLAGGQVDGFEADGGQATWSSNLRLRLRYSPGAQGALPGSLFLKLVDTDTGDGEYFDDSEVTYYLRDYLDVPDAPLVRCYDGAYSLELRRYHLLLDDHSATHTVAAEKQPTLESALALAEGLAALHARWWGADRLAERGAATHDEAHIRRFIAIAEPGVQPILGSFSGELELHWPEMLRYLFSGFPNRLVERSRDLQGFTLIHGDANQTNLLVPRDGDRPLYLIDRQPFDWSLTTWLGAYDLAYHLVLGYPSDLRRRCQVPVLLRYHERLVAHGVQGYPWERLWADYKLCAAMCVYIAVEYCRGGINEQYTWLWMSFLKRSLTACEDLGVF
jgi:thiamine kinase-like enzyme